LAQQAEYWRRALAAHAPGAREVLEIGSFTGGSARLFLTLLPDARITCVDPFTGDLHGGDAYNGDTQTIEARFDAALAPFPGRVEKIVGRSVPTLDALGVKGRRFDVIYIDGSHRHDDILVDSLLTWPLLRVGGLMMFDDYRGGGDWPAKARPRHAIESFLALHCEHRVVHARYQLYAVKTAAPQPLRTRLSWARRRLIR
jgi:predicted O-methyltransferase YrrM